MLRSKQTLFEFMRYSVVGTVAFFIDFYLLFLLTTFIFFNIGHIGILIATALGFLSGQLFYFAFSMIFVFRNNIEYAKKHKIRSISIFFLIGISGLLLTALLMHIGVILFGESYYLVIKIFIGVIVFLWNFLGRKIFVFR